MVNRALVYTIYPNEKQNIQCQKTFGCCRFVYNQMLDVQKERHENGEKHLSKTKANTYCNQHLKKKETKTLPGYSLLKDSISITIPKTLTTAEAKAQKADLSKGKYNEADLCTDCDCDGIAYWCRNLQNQ